MGQHVSRAARHITMTAKPSRSELEQLDKPALIDLLLQLLERIEQLEQRVPTPPTTSNNSSQPPARDQKPAQRPLRGKAKHGPKFGHPGAIHPWVETPDLLVPQRVAHCAACGADLTSQPQSLEQRHQLVELPPILTQVIEVQLYGCTCPACGIPNRAAPPAGMELQRCY